MKRQREQEKEYKKATKQKHVPLKDEIDKMLQFPECLDSSGLDLELDDSSLSLEFPVGEITIEQQQDESDKIHDATKIVEYGESLLPELPVHEKTMRLQVQDEQVKKETIRHCHFIEMSRIRDPFLHFIGVQRNAGYYRRTLDDTGLDPMLYPETQAFVRAVWQHWPSRLTGCVSCKQFIEILHSFLKDQKGLEPWKNRFDIAYAQDMTREHIQQWTWLVSGGGILQLHAAHFVHSICTLIPLFDEKTKPPSDTRTTKQIIPFLYRTLRESPLPLSFHGLASRHEMESHLQYHPEEIFALRLAEPNTECRGIQLMITLDLPIRATDGSYKQHWPLVVTQEKECVFGWPPGTSITRDLIQLPQQINVWEKEWVWTRSFFRDVSQWGLWICCDCGYTSFVHERRCDMCYEACPPHLLATVVPTWKCLCNKFHRAAREMCLQCQQKRPSKLVRAAPEGWQCEGCEHWLDDTIQTCPHVPRMFSRPRPDPYILEAARSKLSRVVDPIG